ncbi:MAG: DUF599 domain-containing protein [Candidatus Bipolaricaulota bacterium]|nr:DUF599 domain-containing protein [Candidatus Bipolaricaulota bacterium]MDW8030789.1 DUF599 domain-containing protein [Candidatus Bipolaricaulota bacterium]
MQTITPETIVALLTFFVCFYGYHFVYFYLSRRHTHATRKGRMRQAIAGALVQALHEGDHLLVVHQLRNIIMAVTFLASASVLLLSFIISFSGVWETIIELPQLSRRGLRPYDYPVWTIILTLAVSFFSFLTALRYFNLLSMLISAPPEALRQMEGTEPTQYLTDLFMRGSDAYTLGRRGFIYSVVAALWFLHVWVFVGVTLVVTAWVAVFDR